MATLLSIIQDFCGRTNITVPTAALGSTDPQVIQIVKLLEEEGVDLAVRADWEVLTDEGNFTSLATEAQGSIFTIASDGFRSIKNETFWSRSSSLPVLGPLSSKEWQTLKAVANKGPRYYYRIRGDQLLMNPAPAAGLSFYFEYVSKNWIVGADTVKKARFTVDSDIIRLDYDLVTMGLRWRWKKEKGFDYAEDFRTYEDQVAAAMGRDGGKPTLQMGGANMSNRPGVFVPIGSWNLP